ncbi:MAG: NAD-dependent epimerase/dehydratase family protein [Oceanicoccus sp.]
MRILVTGSKGFLGRHLCTVLHAQGHQLTCVVRESGVSSFESNCVVVPNIAVYDSWPILLENIDVVIHCASINHCKNNDTALFSVNVEGSRRLIDAATKSDVRRFIYISSLKVLGEKTVSAAFSSECQPDPVGAYAQSKLAAEDILVDAASHSRMEYVVIRPPLIFGPGVKANFLQLIRVAKIPLPLPLDSITNQRDMISTTNLCDLISVCIDHPKAKNQIFLASDGCAYSLRELLSTIRKVLGRPSGLFPIPVQWLRGGLVFLGKGAIADRLFNNLEVDISHTKNTLGWRPKYTLEDTLREMEIE